MATYTNTTDIVTPTEFSKMTDVLEDRISKEVVADCIHCLTIATRLYNFAEISFTVYYKSKSDMIVSGDVVRLIFPDGTNYTVVVNGSTLEQRANMVTTRILVEGSIVNVTDSREKPSRKKTYELLGRKLRIR